MDDLLREFLTETSESLDTVDNQLVRFEQDPSDAKILDNIFRLVHTIKGTCGFLGLPRLEALAHAGETLMGKFRDGMPVKAEAVTLILSSHRSHQGDPGRPRSDRDRARGHRRRPDREAACDGRRRQPCRGSRSRAAPVVAAPPVAPAMAPEVAKGTLVDQVLERPLRPGEVSLDDLERAFRETETEAAPKPAPAPAPKPAPQPRLRPRKPKPSKGSQGKTRAQGGCRRRRRRPGSRQDRQPVDPRQRGHAGTSDDHGLRAGADPQPAPGNLPPQRGHRVQGAAAAALQRHRRTAGRRHEDADAADRQRLAEAAAHRPRPLRRTRQADRTGDARRRHRARPPGARPDQGSADAHGAQLRRPRPGDAGRAAGLRQGRAGHHPAVRLSRGRPHHHLHRRQWPRAQHRADQGQGGLQTVSSARPNWRR